MCAVHGPRRRSLEIDAFGIVAAAVTRALEFVFGGFPVRRAAQMSAHRVDHEDAFGIAHHPDAVFVLKFRIHAETEIRRVTDEKSGLGFEERARKKESQEHQKIDAQET